MVLTKSELIGSLQNEVRILLHLAGKADARALDYRPTPKQRSAFELLQYLTIMGPALIRAARAGRSIRRPGRWPRRRQPPAIWTDPGGDRRAEGRIRDAAGRHVRRGLRTEVEMFGMKTTRGAFIVNMVLCGCAAYRTQLFLYLKGCGREELSTMNLWAGMDPPAPQA